MRLFFVEHSTNRHGLGAPDMRPFDARWPCPFAPLSTLHLPPHGDRRMTRGESGWLVLPFYRTLTGCPSPVGLALARVVADHPRWPLSSECFSRCRYLLRPLRLLPVGATVTGRDSHPLRNGAFHGAPGPNAYLPTDSTGRLTRVVEPAPPQRASSGSAICHVERRGRGLGRFARQCYEGRRTDVRP